MLKRLRNAISAGMRELRNQYQYWPYTLADSPQMGAGTAAGVSVSEESAMRHTAVHACVELIASTIAQLPLHLYRIDGERREPATEHPLYNILHLRPNPYSTSSMLRHKMQESISIYGNAVAEIIRDRAGRIVELREWDAQNVRIQQKGFDLRFFFKTESGEVELPEERVFHIPGRRRKGRIGLSPISAIRETIGEGLAAADYGARFFSNNARPGGVINFEGKWDDGGKERFKSEWQAAQSGPNQHRVAILEKGMTYTPFEVANNDAQWLEARKFNRNEIASIYQIPPHMIGNLDRATFSNIEQQSLEYVIYSMTPHLVHWEQLISLNLLTEAERKIYFARFNVNGLLRGDSLRRWQSYHRAHSLGAMSANEIRKLEDMNPREGGDEFFVPVNMAADSGDKKDEEENNGEQKQN